MKVKKTLASIAATIFAMTSVATMAYAGATGETGSTESTSSESQATQSPGDSGNEGGDAGTSFDDDEPDAYEEFSKEGVETEATGLGCSALTKANGKLTVSANVKDANKFKGYSIQVGFEDFATSNFNSTSDLTAKQISEIAKLVPAQTTVLKVALAKEKNKDGDLATEHTAPAPITFEISGLAEDVHVYHIGKKSIEEVKVTMDATIGAGKTATFSAQNFSDFIITKGEIKKGLTAAADADESGSSAAANNGGTNPETGISLALAPVALTAAAIGVVVLKKKH